MGTGVVITAPGQKGLLRRFNRNKQGAVSKKKLFQVLCSFILQILWELNSECNYRIRKKKRKPESYFPTQLLSKSRDSKSSFKAAVWRCKNYYSANGSWNLAAPCKDRLWSKTNVLGQIKTQRGAHSVKVRLEYKVNTSTID